MRRKAVIFLYFVELREAKLKRSKHVELSSNKLLVDTDENKKEEFLEVSHLGIRNYLISLNFYGNRQIQRIGSQANGNGARRLLTPPNPLQLCSPSIVQELSVRRFSFKPIRSNGLLTTPPVNHNEWNEWDEWTWSTIKPSSLSITFLSSQFADVLRPLNLYHSISLPARLTEAHYTLFDTHTHYTKVYENARLRNLRRLRRLHLCFRSPSRRSR